MLYLMVSIMPHLGYDQEREAHHQLSIKSLHTLEGMPPEMVHRPEGTKDWLFMFYYDPCDVWLKGKPHRLEPNTLVIWEPNTEHNMGNPEKRWRHSWFFATGSAIKPSMNQAGLECETAYTLHKRSDTELFFQDIYNEIATHHQANERIIVQLFDIWLQRVARDIAEPETHDNRLLELKRHITNNLDQDLSLKSLADYIGLSTSHLSSEFKRQFDCSPVDFVIKQRLEHAKYLLSNHMLRVNQIAQRVGYNDVFHFSRIFKKHFGVSPKIMRQQGGQDH